jgi:hypothetical protein
MFIGHRIVCSRDPSGRELARDEAITFNIIVGCYTAIASRLACMVGLEGRRRDKARF